jgi:hypothetical protein
MSVVAFVSFLQLSLALVLLFVVFALVRYAYAYLPLVQHRQSNQPRSAAARPDLLVRDRIE